MASPVAAQRKAVLDQIALPHNYYYREMYLPQATSGPSAVAWSPDGREIAYSMQGSLWRQRLGSTDAEQLTDGPGYDYQPDWSPDGRRIVYASYRGKDEELWELDLATGHTHALVADGAVNVEPRWSPDGHRLAYVSTAYHGRFHIFVAPVEGDTIGPAERVSADRDSHLPRYYYSVYDHYLSPTWSPDGTELLFVSNRGHVWGSGGIWRAPVAHLDSAREIRSEETTWKARPDWSPDGQRVVYSSYLGRQWHGLWVMRADGANPLELTYGDFDATAPRWSPDGQHIAYIVNEDGNTALRILDLSGGAVHRVASTQRHYRGPVGRLRVMVVDAATGRAMAARLSITGPDGRSFAPDNAWRHADDSFDRRSRPLEVGYFHSTGTSELTVPAGTITIDVSRGLELRPVTRRVDVSANGVQFVRISLARLANMRSTGWYSGDVHVHMNYGGAYRDTPSRLAEQARAEDLQVVENLIVNKEGRMPDVGYFSPHPDTARAPVLVAEGQEYHTSYWGHFGLLGLRDHVLVPGYAAYAATAVASLVPTNADVADLAHAQGAITGYVHPFDTYPDPADTTQPLTDELPVDVALGKVDYMEIVGFSDHRASARVWYQLLNCGFRVPAAAGTDAMANFASLRGPVGLNRVYVHSGRARALDHRAWLAALAAGRTFATNGPLVGLTIDGHEIGDEIRLPAGHHTLHAHVTLRSIVPVDHLEIVARGGVVDTIPLAGDHTTATADLDLPIEHSDWLTLRAWSDSATAPILDIYPFATTSPIYVTVAGEPVRSATDAAYFLRWLDRLEANVRAFTAWNVPAERDHVLRQITQARTVFRERQGSQ